MFTMPDSGGIDEPMDASTDQIPLIALRGAEIPQLGFGVFQVPPKDTADAVENALDVGYRHLDTAAAYRNEAAVGRAVRASGLDRDEVFVTTKCWNDDQGYERAKRAFSGSLERLEFEYVDLYLITGRCRRKTCTWTRGGLSSTCSPRGWYGR